MNLAAAITNAIAANGVLRLPPGEFHINTLAPFVINGRAFALRGAGQRLTTIIQDDPAAGLAFDCSQGDRAANVVEVSDLSLVAGIPGCGLALSIDYGTAILGSMEDRTTAHVHNVECRGWRDAFFFRSVWNGIFSSLFAAGDEAGYVGTGAGSGTAMTLAGCVACQFSGLKFSWHNLGIGFTQAPLPNPAPPGAPAAFGSQGINISNYITMEVLSALVNNPVAGDGFGAIIVSNFNFDNGNRANARHANVVLGDCNGLGLVNGVMLQSGGIGQICLTDCLGARILGVDLAAQPGVTASIWLQGATADSVISGCRFKSTVPAIWLGPQTTNNLVAGNRYGAGGNVNLSGKANTVERS